MRQLLRRAGRAPAELITDAEAAAAAVRDTFRNPKQRLGKLDARVQATLDEQLRLRGDDGLLEYLRELPGTADVRLDVERRRVVVSFADALLNRRLAKRVAVQSDVKREPRRFYEEHGTPAARRALEQAAARFADVKPAWKVLIWLPDPRMRLKAAEVLVDDGSEIQEFVRREEKGKERGIDIYRAHSALWAISVLVHADLKGTPDQDVVLAYLARRLNIKLGGLEERLGDKPYEWPDRLAAEDSLEDPTPDKVENLIAFRRKEIAAYTPDEPGREPTFKALAAQYQALAKSL